MHFINDHFINTFRETASTGNIQTATQRLLDEIDLRVTNGTGSFPLHGPNLIVANHLGIFDVFVILSQLQRSDIYFIGVSTYTRFGNELTDHLLPVYLSGKPADGLEEWVRIMYYSDKEGYLSRTQAQEKNKKTISKAAEYISNGAQVIMFPAGGDAANLHHWRHGVGYLVQEIKNSSATITFAHIQGSRRYAELLRYLHPMIHMLFAKEVSVRIDISQPYPLDFFQTSHLSGKEISGLMENTYKRLFKDL